MLSINTNISSLIAQSSMKQSTNKLNQAIERMTTGFKINHASDNAANYAISTRMSTELNSLQVVEENTAMGIDLISTAEGTLNELQDRIERLRALQEQANNGTYGEQSLNAINAEANALVDEINRLYETAEYNGITLFIAQSTLADGTTAVVKESDAQLDTTFKELGITATAFDIYDASDNLIQSYDLEENDSINDFLTTLQAHGFTTKLNNGEITISSTSNSYIAGELADALEISTQEDVRVSSTEQINTIWTTTTTETTQTNTIYETTTVETTTVTNTESISTNYVLQTEVLSYKTVSTEPTGETFYTQYDDDTVLVTSFSDPSVYAKVYFSDGTELAYTTSDAYSITWGELVIPESYTWSEENGYYLDSAGNQVQLVSEYGYLYTDEYGAPVCTTLSVYGTETTNVSTTTAFVTATADTVLQDTFKITESTMCVFFSDGSHLELDPPTDTIQDLIDGINNAGKGLTASLNNGVITVSGTGDITIDTTTSAVSNLFYWMALDINTTTSTTTVSTTQTIMVDVVNEIIEINTILTTTTSSTTNTTTLLSTSTVSTTQTSERQRYESSVTSIYAPGKINLFIGINADENSNINVDITFDLRDISEFRNIGIDGNDYLEQLDNLLAQISEKQVQFGAALNRLESVMDEIGIRYDNLVSSRSTIRDADIAVVSASYIQQQILQQASATLLATANQSPSIALQLI